MDGDSDSEHTSSTHYTGNMSGHQNSHIVGAGSELPPPAPVIVIEEHPHEPGSTVRSRNQTFTKYSTDVELESDRSCIYVAENSIEAKKISNNFMFGMKKWKSHVTSRPLRSRSEIVQDLYKDLSEVKNVKVSTIRPFNILYTLLFGWWLALLYVVVGCLMCITVVGLPYAKFCWRFAGYFFWPFGKFVHRVHGHSVIRFHSSKSDYDNQSIDDSETQVLLGSQSSNPSHHNCTHFCSCYGFWKRPLSYVWLFLGLPILIPAHAIVFGISWFFVISIPTAKLNSKTLTKILFMQPEELHHGHSENSKLERSGHISEIIMYSHQSVNFYYYKYTVDGVNVILANLLVFVVISIVLGYAVDDSVISSMTKCILAVLAIIPLTYYIGMAITSISAQSSFAVGAFLNATFGSMVEVILFIIMLKKGKDSDQECYQELVKSSLTGAILCSILFIPGMSMIIGGLKFRTQRFNSRSASISASLLFVAIVGVFAPTIFSKIFGSLYCKSCETLTNVHNQPINSSSFICQTCENIASGIHHDHTLYLKHIRPLVYAISVILPIAYIIGLVYTMKTHSAHVFEEFEKQLKEENIGSGHGGEAMWSKTKSTIILLICAVSIALSADLISENIQSLLEASGISEYFIGVTMLSLVTELPEVVNGVQFALQNNVNLGIEIGCSTAIQVCLVQIPLLVFVNLIYPMGFFMVFNDVHLWAVIFSVIIINYIFQDGKSDYFQGSIVVCIYILLMFMYFFILTPDKAVCRGPAAPVPNTTHSNRNPFLLNNL